MRFLALAVTAPLWFASIGTAFADARLVGVSYYTLAQSYDRGTDNRAAGQTAQSYDRGTDNRAAGQVAQSYDRGTDNRAAGQVAQNYDRGTDSRAAGA